MTYDLAKKLKDAGFPQEDTEWYWGKEWGSPKVFTFHKNASWDRENEQSCAKPTLSELIEACPRFQEGENEYWFSIQWQNSGGWRAGYLRYDTWHDSIGEGATPEEEVVNFYLEINKK